MSDGSGHIEQNRKVNNMHLITDISGIIKFRKPP